ncbi:NAD(P)-binding domain-containing protein [Mesorhizobium sp. M0615]
MSDITVIGLGAMGTALAEAFLNQGHAVTVWNRSPAKAEALAAKGAIVAKSVEEAVRSSPLIVACLLVYDTAREVLGPSRDALSGRTLVNLTNGTPEQARAMSGWAVSQGASYIDGGIMAVPPMIGGPHALILYSGSRQAFDACSGQLGALGTSKFLGEDAGLAPLYDISLLTGHVRHVRGRSAGVGIDGRSRNSGRRVHAAAGLLASVDARPAAEMGGTDRQWRSHQQCRFQPGHAG